MERWIAAYESCKRPSVALTLSHLKPLNSLGSMVDLQFYLISLLPAVEDGVITVAGRHWDKFNVRTVAVATRPNLRRG